jgi:hypothetical protein
MTTWHDDVVPSDGSRQRHERGGGLMDGLVASRCAVPKALLGAAADPASSGTGRRRVQWAS